MFCSLRYWVQQLVQKVRVALKLLHRGEGFVRKGNQVHHTFGSSFGVKKLTFWLQKRFLKKYCEKSLFGRDVCFF